MRSGTANTNMTKVFIGDESQTVGLNHGYGDGDGNGYGNGYGDGNGNGNGYGYGDKQYWFNSVQYAIKHEDKNKLSSLEDQGVLFAYWRSNKDGTPSNGGSGTKAVPGLVEEIKGPLKICTKDALHGTYLPAKWKGDKIWIVALYPPFQFEEDKVASLKREIICEAKFTL